MTAPEIKTFRQYVEDARRSAARRHGVTMAEVTRELPEHHYEREWRDYVVRTFNDGGTIATALWCSFDEGVQYRVLRTPRALRDDALTHDLHRKTVPA